MFHSNPFRGLQLADGLMRNVKDMKVYRNPDLVFIVDIVTDQHEQVAVPASYISLLFNMRDSTPPPGVPFPARSFNMLDAITWVKLIATDVGICMPVFEYAFALYINKTQDMEKLLLTHLMAKRFDKGIAVEVMSFM